MAPYYQIPAYLRNGLARTRSLLGGLLDDEAVMRSCQAYPNGDANKPVTAYATEEDLVPLGIGCLLPVGRCQLLNIRQAGHSQREGLRIRMIRLCVEYSAIWVEDKLKSSQQVALTHI